MASHGTFLTISNLTDNNMTITVSETNNYDWDGYSRPDHNFHNVVIPAGGETTQREELNAHAASAWYRMTMSFKNGDEISLRNDQYDARRVFARPYPLGGRDSCKYRAEQEAGNDHNRFRIGRALEPTVGLTVMSWNLDKNGTGKDGKQEAGLQPILDAFGSKVPIPDVLLLQETKKGELSKFLEQLGKLTGKKWTSYGEDEQGREEGNANAILSWCPIEKPGVLFFKNQCGYGGRNAVYCDVSIPGYGPYRVYSAHLESGKGLGEYLSNEAANVRIQQFQEIRRHATCANSIIGGDFNGTDIEDFQIGGFHHSHGCLPGPTYTCDSGIPLGTRRLDYILVSSSIQPEIEKIDAGTGYNCQWISDHLPIWAKICLRKNLGDTLKATQYLGPNDRLYSADGNFFLVYQGDGNLVIYSTTSGQPKWASGTNGPAWRTVMQEDGNFVVYPAPGEKAVFNSGTYRSGAVKLVLENTGKLTLYKADGTLVKTLN